MTEFTQEQINAYMELALVEAQKGFEQGEVPIGAVLVKDGEVIVSDHNRREQTNLAIDHAEINVIQKANEKLGSWRLEDTALFVTVEPCLMCAGAIIQSRIPQVFYGAKDPKFGAVDSLYETLNDERSNHRVQVVSGVLQEKSVELMQSFFRKIRSSKK